MNSNIFRFALQQARSSDWERFEQLCSSFLVSEFPSLRTMAAPAGDGGRDSELFSPDGNHKIVFQYSVAKDWKKKIRHTEKRLKKTFPDVSFLIYLSNQTIGADGDGVKTDLLTEGIALDIRDVNWLVERCCSDDTRYEAAKRFCDEVAVPILEDKEIIQRSRPSLTSLESKAALTYLSMQWEDESTGKGLSKVAYEALVLSALRKTDSDKRLTRGEVHEIISGYLVSSDPDVVHRQVESALRRLTKKKIRHWTKEGEFCLMHEEVLRLNSRLVDSENEEAEFKRAIEKLVIAELDEGLNDRDLEEYVDRLTRILDRFLLKAGESYAASVASGEVSSIDRNTLYNAVLADIEKHPEEEVPLKSIPDLALNVIARLCSSRDILIRKHLKKISDSYTIFSFLRETPDVQKATKKIFSHGKIWIDTTIILPLLAESFLDEEGVLHFTNAITTLRDAGMELYVTDGVVQELLSHIKNSAACSTYSQAEWRGRVPYLYQSYIRAGLAPSTFRSAMETFRGDLRPEDDMADYLYQMHGVSVRPLSDYLGEIDEDLRFATERLWTKAHEERRGSGGESSIDDTVDILIKHDVESYLGVLALRKRESAQELGYEHWWLTIDSVAWKIRDKLKAEINDLPRSPLMSLDFLLNSISFGPARARIDRDHEQLLPLLLDLDFSVSAPTELLEVADRIRRENEGAPEHVITRKVRDACDRMKGRYGTLSRSGQAKLRNG